MGLRHLFVIAMACLVVGDGVSGHPIALVKVYQFSVSARSIRERDERLRQRVHDATISDADEGRDG